MRTPRLWKVKKLAQGQVRDRIPPGKVLSELREKMVKDRVKLSGDTGILDDIHKGSAIGNSVVCSQERDQPPESAGLGQTPSFVL